MNGATAIGADVGLFGAGIFSTAMGAGFAQSATAKGDNSVAIGGGSGLLGAAFGAIATGNSSIAIGTQTQASGDFSTVIGQGASATGNNSVALGQGSVAGVANTISVGTVGGERQIVNVAGGSISSGSTAAMNGGQLFTANQRVAATFGGGAGLDSNGQLTAPTYTIQGANFNNVGGALVRLDSTITNINNTGTSYFQSNSAGPAASVTGANGLAMGSGAVSSATNAVAIGTGAQATQAGAVAIGSGSVTSAPNTVSVGSTGNERRITNVAAGINPTDAVNVGQISGLSNAFQSQITGLQTQVYDNRTEARRGVAAAVATASASMPSAPGKTTWQLRASTFQNEYGVGFGFAHRLRTDMPLSIVGGYGNGGGNQHTGYVGVGGEF